MKTSEVHGIFYRKTGNGPCLFLLHGFPESGVIWRDVWDDLSQHFTLIIPDFPGSGNSQLTGPASLIQMAMELKEIMDAENILNAVIAGHSMGGYIAFAFASLYPELVLGLCMVHSTSRADDDEKKKIRKKAIDIITRGAKEAFLNQVVSGLFSEKFKLNKPEFVKKQVSNACLMSDMGIINFYYGMMNREDYTYLLENTRFPVQWIMGENDTVLPYEKLIPVCYQSSVNFVSFYKDCAHMSMFEMPDRLVSDITEFAIYCSGVK